MSNIRAEKSRKLLFTVYGYTVLAQQMGCQTLTRNQTTRKRAVVSCVDSAGGTFIFQNGLPNTIPQTKLQHFSRPLLESFCLITSPAIEYPPARGYFTRGTGN